MRIKGDRERKDGEREKRLHSRFALHAFIQWAVWGYLIKGRGRSNRLAMSCPITAEGCNRPAGRENNLKRSRDNHLAAEARIRPWLSWGPGFRKIKPLYREKERERERECV